MQQTQPALSMVAMQSQQDWIISQQALSPLVQVTHMPLSVISHLHMPMVRLQQQTTHAVHHHAAAATCRPPSSVQRCCIMLQAALSSHVQVIFMPPVHFSIFMVQRGIMSHCTRSAC